MSDDMDGFSIVEGDQPGKKVDFNTMLMVALMQLNRLLGTINDVPPGLHAMAIDLKSDDLKPNRINYVNAVDGIEISLSHILMDDKHFKDELKALDETEMKDIVEKAKLKHGILIKVMAKNGLLPLQVM